MGFRKPLGSGNPLRFRDVGNHQEPSADGNVQVTLVWGGNTYAATYTWEPGSHRLTSVTRTENGNVTWSGTFEYDPLNRVRKFYWNGNNCQRFNYVGDSDWLGHASAYNIAPQD